MLPSMYSSHSFLHHHKNKISANNILQWKRNTSNNNNNAILLLSSKKNYSSFITKQHHTSPMNTRTNTLLFLRNTNKQRLNLSTTTAPNKHPEQQQQANNNDQLSSIFIEEGPPSTPAQKGMTFAAWAVILSVVGICGYSVFVYVAPFGLSANAVFNESFERIRNHSEVVARLGTPIKGYGKGTGDGRRNWIDYDQYIDDDGLQRTRVKYNVEGPNGKAILYAEKVKGSDDFAYLILEHGTRGRHDVIALLDNRKQLTREELQDKVTKRLAGAGVVLFGHERDQWSHRQRDELGEFADRIRYISCDKQENLEECTKANLKAYPTLRVQEQNIPGFKTLEELQMLARLI
jgi:hypothetical protein